MMGQGVVLMVAGMGIVYLFLYVLIAVSKWTSGFVSRFDFLVAGDTPKKAARAGGMAAAALHGDAENCGLEDVNLGSFRDLLTVCPSLG